MWAITKTDCLLLILKFIWDGLKGLKKFVFKARVDNCSGVHILQSSLINEIVTYAQVEERCL